MANHGAHDESAPATVASLEAGFPSWMCWTVPTWDGKVHGLTWCARRWSGEGEVLNAATARRLVEMIEAAEAGR